MLGLPLGVQKIKGTDNSKEENDHSKKISKLVSETDELFTADKMTELLELLKPYEGEDDVEIQWRLARACYKVAILPSTSKEDKKRLAYEALDHIQRALSLNSDNFATQEVCSFSLSCVCVCVCTIILRICVCVTHTHVHPCVLIVHALMCMYFVCKYIYCR